MAAAVGLIQRSPRRCFIRRKICRIKRPMTGPCPRRNSDLHRPSPKQWSASSSHQGNPVDIFDSNLQVGCLSLQEELRSTTEAVVLSAALSNQSEPDHVQDPSFGVSQNIRQARSHNLAYLPRTHEPWMRICWCRIFSTCPLFFSPAVLDCEQLSSFQNTSAICTVQTAQQVQMPIDEQQQPSLSVSEMNKDFVQRKRRLTLAFKPSNKSKFLTDIAYEGDLATDSANMFHLSSSSPAEAISGSASSGSNQDSNYTQVCTEKKKIWLSYRGKLFRAFADAEALLYMHMKNGSVGRKIRA